MKDREISNIFIASILKAMAIYLTVLALICLSSKSEAMDYDVDWVSSAHGVHVLRITIDKCTTLFDIKDENLEKFAKDSNSYKEVIATAIKREQNGCR